MRRIAITGIFILLLVCAAPAMAGLSFLYRFDTRPPSQIFAMGFTPKGSDTNLVNHFTGSYDESSFVSTTSSFEVALRFARIHMEDSQARRGYIYRINADGSFYDVNASMRSHMAYLVSHGYERSLPRYTTRIDVAVADLSWEQEYATPVPIPGTSISWAIPVTGHSSATGGISLTQGDVQPNPGAFPSDSFVNSQPYPIELPLEDDSPCSSPASEDLSSDDEEPLGGACANDIAAVPLVAASMAYMHAYHLPDCSFPSSRKRRDTSIPTRVQCSSATLKLVNLSRLRRLIPAIANDQRFGSDPEARTEL